MSRHLELEDLWLVLGEDATRAGADAPLYLAKLSLLLGREIRDLDRLRELSEIALTGEATPTLEEDP